MEWIGFLLYAIFSHYATRKYHRTPPNFYKYRFVLLRQRFASFSFDRIRFDLSALSYHKKRNAPLHAMRLYWLYA